MRGSDTLLKLGRVWNEEIFRAGWQLSRFVESLCRAEVRLTCLLAPDYRRTDAFLRTEPCGNGHLAYATLCHARGILCGIHTVHCAV